MLSFYLLFIKFIIKFNITEKATRGIKTAGRIAAAATDKLLFLCSVAAFYFVDGIKRLKSYKFKLTPRTVSVCVSLCLCLVVGAFTACHTGAVAVVVDGKTVGYVENGEAADNISKLVYNRLQGGIELADLEFKNSFVLKSEVGSVTKAADSALLNMNGLEKKCGLFVDGMLTAVADNETAMHRMLDTLVNSYKVNGMVFSGFANAVAVDDIYVSKGTAINVADTVEDFLSGATGIKVKTSRVETYEEQTDFDTEITYDLSKIKGYKRVKRSGVAGLSLVTAEVTYVNGQRSYADTKESVVIKEPVSEIVVAGMCDEAITQIKTSFSAEDIKSVTGEFMLFPCERTERTYISSFWGDNRGHEGLDIASPYGSEIYAALDGVVTFSGWYGDYGKCIIVEHADGKTKTLYSHCSSLLVDKGQTVTAGQVIARVGSTGYSTGNHLHFSVIVNGRQVDPALYLGIKR